jgi:hypothetical protein
VGRVDRGLANEAFGIVNHYDRGFLPFAGGIYDQPNKMLQMIEVVRAVKQNI